MPHLGSMGSLEERSLLLLHGWKEGLIPFPRNEYWVLKHQMEIQQLLTAELESIKCVCTKPRTLQHDAQGSPESASEGHAAPKTKDRGQCQKYVMQAPEKGLHACNNGLDTSVATQLLHELESFIWQKGGNEDGSY